MRPRLRRSTANLGLVMPIGKRRVDMADGKRHGGDGHAKADDVARTPNGLLGSLRDALKAASRSDAVAEQVTDKTPAPLALDHKTQPAVMSPLLHGTSLQVQAPTPAPAIELRDVTTRIVRGAAPPAIPQRTKLVRGKVDVERGAFHQDPVVAWLVVVGGTGLGAFRPVFEGNNTVGRGRTKSHRHRLRRRKHLVRRTGLHPLQFLRPLIPVRAEPVKDQCRID